MTYRGYSGRRFGTGERREPKRPARIPSAADLPFYFKPEKPGAGRYTHPTERSRVVLDSIKRFSTEILGFKKPDMKKHHAWTGNVDFVIRDLSYPKGRQPCARFEVKSAARYKTDVHAGQAKRKRRAPRRAGTYEINPQQHITFLRESTRGGCGLFYVLVPRSGESDKAKIEHVGICSLPDIENIMGTKITKRRSIHREVAFECPDIRTWIRWKREA